MDENKPKSKASFSPPGAVIILVILAILALVALVAIPNFIRARTTSAMNACINNLRQIDAAKQQWALENNKTNLDEVVLWDEIKPYLGRGAAGSLDSVYCPHDPAKNSSSSYSLGDLNAKPKC